jgi:hypothetical protein
MSDLVYITRSPIPIRTIRTYKSFYYLFEWYLTLKNELYVSENHFINWGKPLIFFLIRINIYGLQNI